MKRRPNLVLREPVKLYETLEERESDQKKEEIEQEKIEKTDEEKIEPKKVNLPDQEIKKESIKEKLPPRIGQIWNYISRKAKGDGELKTSFSLTRSEVMKEAGIGSTNTYRDALKRFQELGLLEIELRPGVNSGSIFNLTEKGIELID